MRTIFLIEEDGETRRPLVENPPGAGYHLITALNGGRRCLYRVYAHGTVQKPGADFIPA